MKEDVTQRITVGVFGSTLPVVVFWPIIHVLDVFFAWLRALQTDYDLESSLNVNTPWFPSYFWTAMYFGTKLPKIQTIDELRTRVARGGQDERIRAWSDRPG